MLLSLCLTASLTAAGVWLLLACVPWQPYRTREQLHATPTVRDLSNIAVLVPARNEAESIETVLLGLARQGPNLRVRVVNDQSSDATASIIKKVAINLSRENPDQWPVAIELIDGQPLPAGWGGKLWALEQALEGIDRQYCLLVDADVVLAPGVLSALVAEAQKNELAVVSVMAKLRCKSFWEKLLVPAFIYFFKLLYPFALVNRENSRVAAAAGGCILVRTNVLREIGGFSAWSDALIDDCTLARRVKDSGERVQLNLSHDVVSLRGYDGLKDFGAMVSRTAFTQLRYSTALLVATSLAMLVLFVAPIVAITVSFLQVSIDGFLMAAGLSAWLLMSALYLPVVRFYKLGLHWAATLPLAGVLFLYMTWWSAIRYWTGIRASWKARDYEIS